MEKSTDNRIKVSDGSRTELIAKNQLKNYEGFGYKVVTDAKLLPNEVNDASGANDSTLLNSKDAITAIEGMTKEEAISFAANETRKGVLKALETKLSEA